MRSKKIEAKMNALDWLDQIWGILRQLRYNPRFKISVPSVRPVADHQAHIVWIWIDTQYLCRNCQQAVFGTIPVMFEVAHLKTLRVPEFVDLVRASVNRGILSFPATFPGSKYRHIGGAELRGCHRDDGCEICRPVSVGVYASDEEIIKKWTQYEL